MKDSLLRNLHLLIMVYALLGLYDIYEEKTLTLTQAQEETAPLELKVNSANKKLKEISKFKANLKSSQERVLEVVKQIEKVQKQLPSDVNDAQVQDYIGKIANDLKIKDPQPIPGKEELKGFYFAKNFNFIGKGTFLQFLIFFENLTKAERILNVKNVEIKYSDEIKRGRFQVLNMNATVESYRYNKFYKEKVEDVVNK